MGNSELHVVFGTGQVGSKLVDRLLAVSLVAVGLVRVAEGAPSARRAAVSCAALGLVTVALHIVFLAIDRAAFCTPSFIGVLLGVLAVSVAPLLHLPGSSKVDVA